MSRLLFAWPSPMFWKARTRALQQADLWELPREDQAAVISEKFGAAWAYAEADCRAKHGLSTDAPLTKAQREAVFTSATAAFLGPRFFYGAASIKLLNSVLQFTFPILLAATISFIEGRRPLGWLPLVPATGFGCAVLLSVGMVAKAVIESAYFYICTRAGWQLRSAVTTAVFDKSLRLSASARQQRTLGEMVNLMQIDATKLEMFLLQFHVLWDGPVQVAGYIVILFAYIGWPTFIGVVIMVLSLPIQIKIMKATQRIEGRTARATDVRVKTVNEAMQSMASVKMYSWEASLSALINKHRATEIGQRRTLAILLSLARAVMISVPVLVAVAAFVTYALSNGELRASILFAAMAAFNGLRYPSCGPNPRLAPQPSLPLSCACVLSAPAVGPTVSVMCTGVCGPWCARCLWVMVCAVWAMVCAVSVCTVCAVWAVCAVCAVWAGSH